MFIITNGLEKIELFYCFELVLIRCITLNIMEGLVFILNAPIMTAADG